MLDMGFLPDIQKIIALLPARRQNLMFSATFSDDIRRLSGDDPARPGRRSRSRRATRPLEAIRQLVYPVDRDRKEALLAHLIRKHDLRQVLVFTRTKLAATRLARPARPRRASTPSRSTPTARSPSGRARSRASSTGDDPGPRRDRRRGPRPRHRGPARTSSTSSCRGTRRTTSTGSAGPGGPGATGEAISLVCIDETDLLRGVQRMLKQGDPVDGRGGLHPRPRTRRRSRSAVGPIRDGAAAARVAARRGRSISSTASRSGARRKPPGADRPARGDDAACQAAGGVGSAGALGAGVAVSVVVGCAAVAAACAACTAAAPVSTISAPGKKNPSIKSALTRSTV